LRILRLLRVLGLLILRLLGVLLLRRILWLLRVLRLRVAGLRRRLRVLARVPIAIRLLRPRSRRRKRQCADCEAQHCFALKGGLEGKEAGCRRSRTGRPRNGRIHPGFHVASSNALAALRLARRPRKRPFRGRGYFIRPQAEGLVSRSSINSFWPMLPLLQSDASM
jgi:hypothetical protein